MRAHEEFRSWEELNSYLEELFEALDGNDIVRTLALLKMQVSGYVPSTDIFDWLSTAESERSGG